MVLELSQAKNILWACSIHLSVASAELVLPSISGSTNYTFCHIKTRERSIGFSLNFVWKLCHWRLVQTRNSYFPTIVNADVTDDQSRVRCCPWFSTKTSEVIASDDVIARNGVIVRSYRITQELLDGLPQHLVRTLCYWKLLETSVF
jgi:hypothetical protein